MSTMRVAPTIANENATVTPTAATTEASATSPSVCQSTIVASTSGGLRRDDRATLEAAAEHGRDQPDAHDRDHHGAKRAGSEDVGQAVGQRADQPRHREREDPGHHHVPG